MAKKKRFELTVEQVEKMFGEKLDSTIFTWQKYCGTRGVSVLTIFDNDNEMLNDRFLLEGWCNAHSLPCISKNEGFAIMLWDKKSKNKVWCHISVDYSTTLYHRFELREGRKNIKNLNTDAE